MANYATHSALNLTLGLPALILGATLGLGFPWHLTLTAALVFAYGTLFIPPDVDLAYQIRLKSIRGILSLPFRSYAMLFRHRGLSHSFFLGTLTRVIWLSLHAIVVLFLVYQVTVTDKVFVKFLLRHRPYFLAGFAGLFLADTCHLIVDKIWDFRHAKSRARN